MVPASLVGIMTVGLGVGERVGAARDAEVVFIDEDGCMRCESILACWNTRFEGVRPVRELRSRRGLSHWPGLWWAATTGDHIGNESWLERDHVMMLDFEANVVGLSSQPFWLRWPTQRRWRRHAPDFFARLDDGTGVVIDVRADDRIEAADAAVFEATAEVCRVVGWQYRRVGVPDPVLVANVRWLSGYRHSRCLRPTWAAGLGQAFGVPGMLMDGARAVGDPIGVLPVLFHLLWTGALVTDLVSAPLGCASAASVRQGSS